MKLSICIILSLLLCNVSFGQKIKKQIVLTTIKEYIKKNKLYQKDTLFIEENAFSLYLNVKDVNIPIIKLSKKELILLAKKNPNFPIISIRKLENEEYQYKCTIIDYNIYMEKNELFYSNSGGINCYFSYESNGLKLIKID